MKKLTLFLGFIAVLLTINQASAQTSTTLSEKKFSKLLKKNNTILLDVRTTEEYQQGYIPNAKLIDVNKQEEFLQQLQHLDKSKTYLLYCRSGKRSEKARLLMKENGFPKVYHLEGGIEGWQGPKENKKQ